MKPGVIPPEQGKLVILRGAADSMRLTLTDAITGDPTPLTGRTFQAQARDNCEAPVKVQMTATVVDAANGIIDITWTKAATVGAPVGPTRWGMIDDLDEVWIDDSCSIAKATPANA